MLEVTDTNTKFDPETGAPNPNFKPSVTAAPSKTPDGVSEETFSLLKAAAAAGAGSGISGGLSHDLEAIAQALISAYLTGTGSANTAPVTFTLLGKTWTINDNLSVTCA